MNSIANNSNNNVANETWFKFTMLFLVIEYIRPQDTFTFLQNIRPGLVVNIILILFIINNGIKGILSNRQFLYILFFIALVAIYVPFSRNNYYAYQTLLTMLRYVPFIISTIVCVENIDRLKKFVGVWVISATYVALFAIFNEGRGSGNYFVDENDLALFINTGLPFCYFLFLNCKNNLNKLFYGSALFVGILGIVKSFSRGGFIGLISMLFVVFCITSRKILFLIVIGSIATILYFCTPALTGTNEQGFTYLDEIATSMDPNERTAKERLLGWKAAWHMFLDHPLGIGGNNFQVLFQEYQPEGFSRGMWGRVAHSLWFTLLPELGLFGIIIYVSLLGCNMRDIFLLIGLKGNSDSGLQYLYYLGLAILSSFVGYFSSATFLSVLYYPHYWYLTALIISSIRIRNEISDNSTMQHVAI